MLTWFRAQANTRLELTKETSARIGSQVAFSLGASPYLVQTAVSLYSNKQLNFTEQADYLLGSVFMQHTQLLSNLVRACC